MSLELLAAQWGTTAYAVDLPFAVEAQGWDDLGTRVAHSGRAFCLSASGTVAHGVGAQHPGGGYAPVFDHFSKFP